jgi:hypothetical protein
MNLALNEQTFHYKFFSVPTKSTPEAPLAEEKLVSFWQLENQRRHPSRGGGRGVHKP